MATSLAMVLKITPLFLLLLLCNLLCSNYFDSGSVCLQAFWGCVGGDKDGAHVPTWWEEVGGAAGCGRVSLTFITKAGKYFWLWKDVSLIIKNVFCLLAAFWYFLFTPKILCLHSVEAKVNINNFQMNTSKRNRWKGYLLNGPGIWTDNKKIKFIGAEKSIP